MCSLCGDFSPRAHWSDASVVDAPVAERRRHRAARTAFARQLLVAHGLTLAEWQGRYLVGNSRGRTVVTRDLAGVWAAAEQLAGRPADPLSEAGVAALAGGASPPDTPAAAAATTSARSGAETRTQPAGAASRRDGISARGHDAAGDGVSSAGHDAVSARGGVRPLIVLTGFLGSGKTTLLRRALTGDDAGGTAVLVNEVGEIGLDQHQFRAISERTVLLDNGCLCCVTREDLVEALRELVDLEESGAASRVQRVVIETTGLADPRPIVSTIDRDPVLGHRFAVGGVVVTCDAEHAATHAALPEWQAQVACADVVAVTKADRAGPARAASAADAARRRNPAARVVDAAAADPLRPDAHTPATDHAAAAHDHDHTTGVSTASVALDDPVDPALVTVWLSALLHAHGQSLLRVKALLDTGADGPLILDAVQHTVYPPRHLPAWTMPRRSTLVAIARDLDATTITGSFANLRGDP